MSEAPAEKAAAWCLECRGLSLRRGGRLVVRDIDLTLRPGERLALVGPNGSGKTSLLLGLLGLLRPAAGSVQLDGREMFRLPARERGRFAAYVPQSLTGLPAFRVRDVVAGGRHPHVRPLARLSDADWQAVERALADCGLSALADRPLDTLSGGERQKTLIAAAIAQDPQVLMLDEPNTALDPAVQLELVRILRRWHSGGRGLVLISHDLELPAALGGRVVALREGRVAASGRTEEVLTPETLAAIYGARFGIARTPDGRRLPVPEW